MKELASTLQAALELLYRLERSPPVAAFAIGEEFLSALGLDDQPREALLVHQSDEHTELGFYLSSAVREGAAGFVRALGERRIDDLDSFCAALEGVSHFVYFTFAGEVRPVSRLELELQAEIDKFVFLRGVLGLRGRALLTSLFDHFRLSEHLSVACRERYVVANRAARRYAHWADRVFSQGRGEVALADARRLYRMPVSSKLEHIARAA